MHDYWRIQICIWIHTKWSPPTLFAQIPVIFAKNFFSLGFLKHKILKNPHFCYWDCFSILARNWHRSQITDFKCNYQFFSLHVCFSFLWIKHQFMKTADGITWRKQKWKRKSNHKKRHGRFTSCSNVPLAITINSVWKLTTSTHFNSCGS